MTALTAHLLLFKWFVYTCKISDWHKYSYIYIEFVGSFILSNSYWYYRVEIATEKITYQMKEKLHILTQSY